MGIGNGTIKARSYSLRVAVADDDSCYTTNAMLKEYGVEYRVFKSGQSAIDNLKVDMATLMFINLHMPEINGFDVARSISSIKSKESPRFIYHRRNT